MGFLAYPQQREINRLVRRTVVRRHPSRRSRALVASSLPGSLPGTCGMGRLAVVAGKPEIPRIPRQGGEHHPQRGEVPVSAGVWTRRIGNTADADTG